MKNLTEYLPIIIPILIIELALAIAALVHVLRHPKYRFGSKALWIPIGLLIQILGPVAYFIFGRGDNE
jgi:hypothetical protein